MHEISVIISNFNGAKWIPRLMETLREQRGVSLEIIVVDRNSTDGSSEVLAGYPEVKVISHPPETGLVCGYDLGVKSATRNMFFFMNEDMWLAPDCLSLCADLLNRKQQIAAVMPVQWSYDGSRVLNSGMWYKKVFWNRGFFVQSKPYLTKEAARVPYANAGACLVLRGAYELVGGWDTSFFLDDEDTDLSIRFWQHGFEAWVEPRAIVGHALGASNSKTLPSIGSSVSRKRYVGALSNIMIYAFKSFSPIACIRPVLVFLDRSARNLFCCRWTYLQLDIKALILTLNRIPDVAVHRNINREIIAQKPGEGFFLEPAHQHAHVSKRV